MTNFQFLLPEFKPLLEPAQGAEQLVYSDPRGCMQTLRFAAWAYRTNAASTTLIADRHEG